MIGEAMLAIKALDSAFVLVQGAIAKKKDVEDMASEVGKFFTAKNPTIAKQMIMIKWKMILSNPYHL